MATIKTLTEGPFDEWVERQVKHCPCCGARASLVPSRQLPCAGPAGAPPRFHLRLSSVFLFCEPCGYREDLELLMERIAAAAVSGHHPWDGPGDAA